jgi:secreted Zn-dependent insulinase-like peptidase
MYDAYYTAPNMKLVVCSTDSLDTLQATVAKTFMHVRTSSSVPAALSQDGSGNSSKKKKKKKKANNDGGGSGSLPEDSSITSASSSSGNGPVVASSSSKSDGVWPPPPPLNFSQLIGGTGSGDKGTGTGSSGSGDDAVKVYMVQPVRDVNELRLVWGLESEQLSKWKGKASEIVRMKNEKETPVVHFYAFVSEVFLICMGVFSDVLHRKLKSRAQHTTHPIQRCIFC